MGIIKEILSRKEFIKEPPILVDIGASGEINKNWKKLAKYSVCLAFDADDREVDYIENEQGDYKKLILFNQAVTYDESSNVKFFLTKSPFCSSILEPDIDSLSSFPYADLFSIVGEEKVPATNIPYILNQLNYKYVDWFKTDSQGIDLKLFESIPQEIRNNILVIDFEPGIIDGYKKEDKFWHILSYMENYDFWMSELITKGFQRISTLPDVICRD